MDWRRADIVWNRDTYPGLQESHLAPVLEDAMVAVDGAWIHIQRQTGLTTYPSYLVFRVNWHASVGIADSEV